MKTILISIFVALVILSLPAKTFGADTLAVADRVWIVSKTYESISLYFAHWESAAYGPESIDSVYRTFLDQALVTADRNEFTTLMREYIALLQNGHCWYSDFKSYQNDLPLGFEWMYLDDAWVVIQSDLAGLKKGMVVDSINGESTESLYQRRLKYVSGSSDRARRGLFMSWELKRILPDTLILKVSDVKGKQSAITVDRTGLSNPDQATETEGRWIEEGKVAYISIPSFNNEKYEKKALELLDSYRDAACLIVDVRGNRGGNTPSELTSTLMDQPYRWYAESTPMNIGLYRLYAENNGPWWEKWRRTKMSWNSDYEAPADEHFNGKLIILTDRRTGSAAEDFTMPFKDNGRATLIGETTAGSTGQPYNYTFKGIGSIGIGAKRAYFPDGSPFEGIGITPDIMIPITKEDLSNDKDPVLARAIEEAKK